MYRNKSYVFLLFIIIQFSCNTHKKETEYSSNSDIVMEGERLYNQYCASCHEIENNAIGPRLGGITLLLSKQKLTKFIQNPAKEMDSGNERAKLLFNNYKLLMPGFVLLEENKISSILSFINFKSNELNISPLEVKAGDVEEKRLTLPVQLSEITMELVNVAEIPRSGDDPLKTRIATLRASPSGDGSIFVSDQRGIIYRIKHGELSIFLDIRKVVKEFKDSPGMGTGLGSFTFHPDYMDNGLIYITHAENYKGIIADNEYSDTIMVNLQWVLSEWKMNNVNDKVFDGTRRELLRINTPTFAHGVQDIGFIPGLKVNDSDYGMLYIGIGDGGSTGKKLFHLCHNLNSLLGTVIRIDPMGNNSRNGNYGIPSNNPYALDGDSLTREEIWAFGFRNPHRISWGMADHRRMFVAEVGQKHIEEVNIVEKGGDYGWNLVEGDYKLSHEKITDIFSLEPKDSIFYDKAFAQYDHVEGNAISGGYVYNGYISELKGKYIFGDISNGRIFYLNIDTQLSDSTIYEISLSQDGKKTDLKTLSNSAKADLRISYDHYKNEMYIMTKGDGMIRKVIAVDSLTSKYL